MVSTQKKRVLVADDEAHIRQLMRAVLQTMDCEVVAEAANGREAVESYLELRPDVVLLDINMPVMTGTEALKAIRRASDEVAIVMLTSMVDLATVDECIQSGASHYLRKDTPLAEMKQALEKTWGQSGGAEGGEQ